MASGGAVTFVCSGDIKLAAKLTITSNTAIDGAGQSVTLDGQNRVQVISVHGVTLALNNLTIANGNNDASAGGGIDNAGTLTVIKSTFSGNSASAGSGGGIANNGRLTVTKSTFSGNSAPVAGAIANFATAALKNNILAGNSGNCYAPGRITDNGYNVSDDETCGFTAATSLSYNQNARLGMLANNGGPTETIPLLAAAGLVASNWTLTGSAVVVKKVAIVNVDEYAISPAIYDDVEQLSIVYQRQRFWAKTSEICQEGFDAIYEGI